MSQVLTRTGLANAKTILEVGSGSGRFTFHLIRKGLRLTAFDFSEEMLTCLSQAAQRQALNHGQLLVKSGDITKAGELFGVEQFDTIIGFFLLHHLEDARLALKALRGILKKGGELIFIEPNRLNPLFLAQVFFFRDMTWQGEKGTFRHGAWDYRDCMEEAGYTNVEIRKFGFFPPQILDKFSITLKLEKQLEKVPLVKVFLPFLLITARKPF